MLNSSVDMNLVIFQWNQCFSQLEIIQVTQLSISSVVPRSKYRASVLKSFSLLVYKFRFVRITSVDAYLIYAMKYWRVASLERSWNGVRVFRLNLETRFILFFSVSFSNIASGFQVQSTVRTCLFVEQKRDEVAREVLGWRTLPDQVLIHRQVPFSCFEDPSQATFSSRVRLQLPNVCVDPL